MKKINSKKVILVLLVFALAATWCVNSLCSVVEGKPNVTQWLGGLMYSCELDKDQGIYFSPLYHEGAWEIKNGKKTVLWNPAVFNKKVTVNSLSFKLVGSPKSFYIYSYGYKRYYNIFH